MHRLEPVRTFVIACLRRGAARALALVLAFSHVAWAEGATGDHAKTELAARRLRHVESAVARARTLRLHEDKLWLRLLHYRKGLFGRSSEADGRPFFNAENGDSDPEAELVATLRAFYAPLARGSKLQHPYCRFPARFRYLETKLGLDRSLLPTTHCPKYRHFVETIRAKKVVLIFSSYYLNNPASAFGHTFLRMGEGPGEGQDLLDSGIDFSATVDTSNALFYAFKGLFGLFPGEFRKIPYAAKVREYNDFESRDIWEYELSFTGEQVTRIVDHLWELGSTYFDYYYLTENCSYHILGALEVGDPELTLIEPLGFPVLPADTVKALYRNPGFVRGVTYRPSNRTQVERRLAVLSEDERDAAASLLRDARYAFPRGMTQEQQVRALDAAIDLVDIRLAADLLKERKDMDQRWANAQQALLERRASYLVPSDDLEFTPPAERAPNVGHDSTRLGLGSGYSRERGYFHTLNFRLALHDLADPSDGYPEGASIEFLPGSVRYLIESPRVRLERLSLIHVQSLTPLTRFEKTWSWDIDTGLTRTHDRGCRDCLAGFLGFGAGFALAPFGDPLILYALADARVLVPVRSGYWDFLRAAVGPAGGVRLRFSRSIALLGTGSWHVMPARDPDSTFALEGKLRLGYWPNFALGVEGRIEPEAASLEAVSYLYY